MTPLRRAVVRAEHSRRLRYLPELGGATIFLPYPLRKAGAALALLLLFGCTSAVKTVATAQNSYDYRIERYLERCVVTNPPTDCAQVYAELHAYEKHLHEAAKALKNGGGMPLQLGAIKADEKKLAKRAVTK